jgi:plasmid stability protein
MSSAMGQILIRDVDDRIIAALESRAAAHGHVLEDELRSLLMQAARPPRAAVADELRAIRALTPPGPRELAEDLVQEGRASR